MSGTRCPPHSWNDWGTEAPAPPSFPGRCGGLEEWRRTRKEAAARTQAWGAGGVRGAHARRGRRLRPPRMRGPGAHAAPRRSLPPCSAPWPHRRLSFCQRDQPFGIRQFCWGGELGVTCEGPCRRRDSRPLALSRNHGGLDVACGDGDSLIGLEERVTLGASLVPVTTLLRALHRPIHAKPLKGSKSKDKWALPPAREGFLPATPADSKEARGPFPPRWGPRLPVRWLRAQSPGAAPPQSSTASARRSSVTARALNRTPELPKVSKRWRS